MKILLASLFSEYVPNIIFVCVSMFLILLIVIGFGVLISGDYYGILDDLWWVDIN